MRNMIGVKFADLTNHHDGILTVMLIGSLWYEPRPLYTVSRCLAKGYDGDVLMR